MKIEAYSHYKDKLDIPPELPDFVAESVLDIDFTKLQAIGIKYLLFDLDATLRRLGAKALEPEIVSFLTKLQASGSFLSINLVSNNWRNYTYRLRSLKRFSQPIQAHVFRPYFKHGRLMRKPNPLYFQHVLQELGAKPIEAVMIGDKLLADIKGANRAGLFTVYVQPFGSDNLYDRLRRTRKHENILLQTARELFKKLGIKD